MAVFRQSPLFRLCIVLCLNHLCDVQAALLDGLRVRTTTPSPTSSPPASEKSLANCCPYGSSLSEQSGSGEITCSPEVEPHVGASHIWGYHITDTAPHRNGTIECSDDATEPRVIPLEATGKHDLQLPGTACLTRMHGQLSAVICPVLELEVGLVGPPQHHVRFVHKCCPLQYVYDVLQAHCIPQTLAANQSAAFDVYGSLIDEASTVAAAHVAIFLDTHLDCPRDRVVVEYHMRSERIWLRDGVLTLNGDDQTRYGFDEYCLEHLNGDQGRGRLKVTEIKRDKNRSNIEDEAAAIKIPDEFLVRVCEPISICNLIPCIRRCCSDGEMFTKGNATSYCRKDESDVAFHSFDSLEISGNFTKPTVFGILRSLDCMKYRLDPDAYADESHTISERDGSLFVHATQKKYHNDEYCVEKIRNSTWGDQKLYTFLCFDSKVVGNDRIRFKMYPIGLLISCCFYLATLFVYLAVPKLRNLPGKILICLVCSLFAAYLGIALGQLMPAPNDDVCFCSGFFVYFCLMAAFAWMNVTCFDIWQTFGSSRSKHGMKGRQTKRFIIYSAYGWGWPTLLTLVTVSLAKSNLLSDAIRPQFGHGRCWFTYDTLGSANLVFFSGPIGILFLINFVLFLLTLRYCNKVKREIFRMQSSNNEKPALRRRFVIDKARFGMNTKLFVVMGITWLLELLSILLYDHKKTFFWVISDSFNVLLGVSVFVIFVFKKRVWILLQERFGFRPTGTLKSTAPNYTCATPSSIMPSTSMSNLHAIDGNMKLLNVKNNTVTTSLQSL